MLQPFMKGIIPISLNTIFWTFIGLLRDLTNWSSHPAALTDEQLAAAVPQVAVCVPAHNEALVIAPALASLLKLVPAAQIFVVSDGSRDETAAIARRLNCSVLEINPGVGKALALERTIAHFRLLDRYQYLLIADADTIFDPHFLRRGLPLFQTHPSVGVVAAYTRTAWPNHPGFSRRQFFIAYRLRLYEFVQQFIMHGQTWHRTNVNPVIPGFACLYRTAVLRHLKFSTPGIIIEDFNMAFQLHRKKLGIIAHDPSVIAVTQDPDNLTDYRRQLLRWNLGFFQTVKHWGFWPSAFWLSLIVSVTELLAFSLLLYLLPILLLVTLIPLIFSSVTAPFGLLWLSRHWEYLFSIYLFLILTDYIFTVYIAWRAHQYKLIVYGLGFIFLRYIDAATMLIALVKTFTTASSGIWQPPVRRAH